MDTESKKEINNEATTAISEVISKLKKSEPKKGVDLIEITKKLSARKIGKKS